MTAPEDELGSWHGWAHGEAAVYLAPSSEGDRIGLYMQQTRSTEMVGMFADAATAQLFMDWMDGALQATGEANTELVRRLQADQPLAFVQRPAPAEPDLPPDPLLED